MKIISVCELTVCATRVLSDIIDHCLILLHKKNLGLVKGRKLHLVQHMQAVEKHQRLICDTSPITEHFIVVVFKMDSITHVGLK